jgi:uncharacterized protein DUF6308
MTRPAHPSLIAHARSATESILNADTTTAGPSPRHSRRWGDVVAIVIERLDGREPLVIERSELVAEVFFRLDLSARPGGYDDYIVANLRLHDRIVKADIDALNDTMRARSKVDWWAELIEKGRLDWLVALGRQWDLFLLDDAGWRRRGCSEIVAGAFEGIKGKYHGPATSTKLLHVKRPALIPVCDSFVQERLGTRPSMDLAEVVEFIRVQGRKNLNELLTVQRWLSRRGIERTLVRVLDALLWSTHPESEFGPVPELLNDWAANRILAT